MEVTKLQILNSDAFTFKQKNFVRKSVKETFNIDKHSNIDCIDSYSCANCLECKNTSHYINASYIIV